MDYAAPLAASRVKQIYAARPKTQPAAQRAENCAECREQMKNGGVSTINMDAVID